MGTISTGPLASLTTKLARKYGIDSFVETGTFHGDAARFAAKLFPRVVTIEIKREYQEQAILQSPGTNIEFLLGDSASLLPDVVASLTGPALFWLDGHAGAGFYADEDNCPLLSELRAIGTSPHPHVILIDDAREFPCAVPSAVQIRGLADAARGPRCRVLSLPVLLRRDLRLHHLRAGNDAHGRR